MGFLTRVGQRRSIPWTQSAPLGLARERGGDKREKGRGRDRKESGLSQHFFANRTGSL